MQGSNFATTQGQAKAKAFIQNSISKNVSFYLFYTLVPFVAHYLTYISYQLVNLDSHSLDHKAFFSLYFSY